MLGMNTRRDLLSGLALCLVCGSAAALGDGFAVEGVWTSGFGDEFTDIGGWEGVFVVRSSDQFRWYSYVDMSDPDAPVLLDAMERVGAACKAHGKAYMTFVPGPPRAAELRKYGFTLFFAASEQSWLLSGARAAADGLHALD